MVVLFMLFFFNDTATTEIYTLSLHDALPICRLLGGGEIDLVEVVAVGVPQKRPAGVGERDVVRGRGAVRRLAGVVDREDRKSTRLNSSHANISYAVFCLKKKKTQYYTLCPLQ